MRPLVATPDGEISVDYDHYVAGRSGARIVPLTLGEVMPLPDNAKLVHLPGRQLIAMDDVGRPVEVEGVIPVAAVLPLGYMRTLLPPSTWTGKGTPLPLFGYTAVAEHGGEVVIAATQSDDHAAWMDRTETPEQILEAYERVAKALPGNRIVGQLRECAVDNRCMTARNTLFGCYEGALPASPACNADCLGCISLQPREVPSPQERMGYAPTAEELCDVASWHIDHGGEIVSFGQGCEGEPLTRGDVIVRATEMIAKKWPNATIHVNTNGSKPDTLRKMIDAGLTSVRISAISFTDPVFRPYYRPVGYGLDQVVQSGMEMSRSGGQVCLNLLTFPGITDCNEELDATIQACRTMGVHQIQMRTLNVDHDWLVSLLPEMGSGLGMAAAVARLGVELPDLKMGNFTRPWPQLVAPTPS